MGDSSVARSQKLCCLESTSQGLAEAPSYILASSHKVGCCTVRPEKRGLENWRGELEKKKTSTYMFTVFCQQDQSLYTDIYTLVEQSIKILTLYIHTVPTARHCLNMHKVKVIQNSFCHPAAQCFQPRRPPTLLASGLCSAAHLPAG